MLVSLKLSTDAGCMVGRSALSIITDAVTAIHPCGRFHRWASSVSRGPTDGKRAINYILNSGDTRRPNIAYYLPETTVRLPGMTLIEVWDLLIGRMFML